MKQSDHFRENAENCAQLAERATARRSGVKGSRNCCMLLPTRTTNGCQRLPARALPRSALNCRPQAADYGVRSDDLGLAAVQPDEQMPSLHSRVIAHDESRRFDAEDLSRGD